MIDIRNTTVIIADSDRVLRTGLAEALQDEGFSVIACPDGTAALDALQSTRIDALITDLRLPGVCGMDLIKRAAEITPDACIIAVTACGEVETAVTAMKLGARDYLCKPIIAHNLISKLRRLLTHGNFAGDHQRLRTQPRESRAEQRIIGESPVMRELKRVVRQVSQTRSHVLIRGENGTGKEVLAWAIHRGGVTHDDPFVPVDCTLVNESGFEIALLGHRRDALTGADEDRIGFFEAADGGTLFLDGIDALPIQSQSVLLHAMDQSAVTRVGDTRSKPVAVRIIASTSRDLEAAVRSHTFREDLYYRLNVMRVSAPALRDRAEDIPALVAHFVAIYNEKLHVHCPGFDDDAIVAMCMHPWPCNVRELKNAVERALILARDRLVQPGDLCITATPRHSAFSLTQDLRVATRDFERRYIANALAACHHNKARAATALGIGLSSLYRKIEELGITKEKNHTAPRR